MTVSLEGITLPEDIEWVDEFVGFGVGQSIAPTLTGSLVIEENTQVDGRSITLRTGDEAWVDRSVVEQIDALAATQLADGQTLTLVWGDGRTFDVVFDRSNGRPIEALPVIRRAAAAQTPKHPHSLSIQLLVQD